MLRDDYLNAIGQLVILKYILKPSMCVIVDDLLEVLVKDYENQGWM